MAEGYDPNRSQVSDDKMAEWLREPVTGDITEVPGLGAAAARALAAEPEGVETTHQLFGKFLMLKSSDIGTQEHCDRMWYWLKNKGVDSHRAGIVRCVAEKVENFFPGTYDATAFAAAEGEG